MATVLAMQLVKSKAVNTEPGAEPVGDFDPIIVLMIIWILVGLMSMIEAWKQEFPWPPSSSTEAEHPVAERRWCYWNPAEDAPNGADTTESAPSGAGSSSTPSCENVGGAPKRRAAAKSVPQSQSVPQSRGSRELLYTGHGAMTEDGDSGEDELHVETCPLKYEGGRGYRSCYHCRATNAQGKFVWITKFGACFHNHKSCGGLEKATTKGWIKKCSCCTPANG